MTALGPTIRAIRKRLGKTMVEFAEMVGCKQSTISRYESGKLIPGRSVLILLLQLARGSERQPVMNALGVTRATAAGWSEPPLANALKAFQDHLALARAGRSGGGASTAMAGFARAAKGIVSSGRPVDPALVSILELWAAHQGSAPALEHFRHAAAYLEVQLKMPSSRRG